MPKQFVKVTGAPGFEDFQAQLILGLHEIKAVDSRGPLSVVFTPEEGVLGIHVIPSEFVTLLPQDNPHAERYRNYWSTVSGRQASDVYIPEALRVAEPSKPTDREVLDSLGLTEGCGAMDPDDWDACGDCRDCTPHVWAKNALDPEKQKELDEAAKKFERTIGSPKPPEK
jgi:hypothetical protein